MQGKKEETGHLNRSVAFTKQEKKPADFKKSITGTLPNKVGANRGKSFRAISLILHALRTLPKLYRKNERVWKLVLAMEKG